MQANNMRRGIAIFFVIGLALAIPSVALATPVFSATTSASGPPACIINSPGGSGSSAQTANATCQTGNGVASLDASSSPGHVGASVSVLKLTNNSVPVDAHAIASLTDTVTFTSTSSVLDGATDPILVSLNFNFGGALAVATGFFDSASVDVNVTVNGTAFRLFMVDHGNGDPFFCIDDFSGITCAATVDGLVVTNSFLVPLDTPISFTLSLEVGAFAQDSVGASASSQFSNSLDFPIGIDVFNLPEGYTANAPDSLIFDNRFIPQSSAVPEPMTLSLFSAGLVGALVMRRRRKTTKAAVSLA